MVTRPFPAVAEFKLARTNWALRLVFLLVAVGLAILSMSDIMVTPWWKREGFASDPGHFIAKNKVGYPVCAPWSEKSEGRVAEASVSAPPGRTVDTAVLLPHGAQVLSITCGVSLHGASPVPCRPTHCVIPLAVTLDDDTYKGGRGLVMTAHNKSSNEPADVTFRIAWK